MSVTIVEFTNLISAARRYLAGTCSIQELYGRAAELATVSRFFGAHPAIGEIAQEWLNTIDRAWNECNHVAVPLSEAEFRSWLERQLLTHARAEA